MANEDPASKGQEFFQMFLKAKEFTEELLKENERLRFKIARIESTPGAPASAAPDDRMRELSARVRELEERLAEMNSRYRKVEEENKEFADRYIEIEEQNNNLANLYAEREAYPRAVEEYRQLIAQGTTYPVFEPSPPSEHVHQAIHPARRHEHEDVAGLAEFLVLPIQQATLRRQVPP